MQAASPLVFEQGSEDFSGVTELPLNPLISVFKATITQDLVPLVQDIDQHGVYPREFMQRVGALQGFGSGDHSRIWWLGEWVKSCYSGD
jgi:hypothetical protein